MKDKFYHWLARHLPRRLVYWCNIVVWTEYTTKVNPTAEGPKVTYGDALRFWE